VQDYLSENPTLKPFYQHFNRLENYSLQMQLKKHQNIDRTTLVEVLIEQNKDLKLSEKTKENIELLAHENTFTVTTGHQLCLFTGPLYFIFKIVSALKLAKTLNATYPNKTIIPVFWMASEDHDFEEINSIQLFGKTIKWNNNQGGAVGRMNLTEMKSVLNELFDIIGQGQHAQELKSIFKKAYESSNDLAKASRYLINHFFSEDGIVIIDGDDPQLKSLFSHVFKKDIVHSHYYPYLNNQSQDLSQHYKLQAHIRKINCFRLTKGKRERIEHALSDAEIENNPGHFSPNVLLRPLYQEILLPNLAYVGGGAEIAYWMQLKQVFDHEKIPFPILVLRNSAMIISSRHSNKLKELGISVDNIFKTEHQLHKLYLQQQKDFVSFEKYYQDLEAIFSNIKAEYPDKALKSLLDSEQQRQFNSFKKMEQKLVKIEKEKHQIALSQLSKIKQEYFPNNSLQERHQNFIPFYLKHGDNFIKKMKEELNPLDTNFVVLEL
jgi:bacillithiol biosynthesis cysteine-adding enzyme BshC